MKILITGNEFMSEVQNSNTLDAKMDTIPEEEPQKGFSWHKLAFINPLGYHEL